MEIKKLLVLCIAIVATLGAMAKPTDVKAKGEHKFPFAKPATTTAVAAAPAKHVVPQVGTKRSSTTWAELQGSLNKMPEANTTWVRNKGVAQAPTMHGDTVFLKLADLPYTVKTTMYGAPIVLIAEADSVITVECTSKEMPDSYFGAFETGGSIQAYGNMGFQVGYVSKNDTLIFNTAAMEPEWAGLACEIRFDFVEHYKSVTPANAKVDSIAVPYSKKDIAIQNDSLFISYYGNNFHVAHIYRFKAAHDTIHTISSNGLLYDMNSSTTFISGEYKLAKDSVVTIAIFASDPNGKYTFAVHEGPATFEESLSEFEVEDITLPFNGTKIAAKINGYAAYALYRFTVTDSVRLQAICTASSWRIYNKVGKAVGDTLVAGDTYYFFSTSCYPSFDLHLATVALDYKQELLYTKYDYKTMKLDVAEYGALTHFDHTLGGAPYVGYKIHLEPGVYNLISTIKNNSKDTTVANVKVLICDTLKGDVNDLMYNSTIETVKKEASDTMMVVVAKAGDYPIVFMAYSKSFSVDYKLLVTTAKSGPYVNKTLPFTDKGTITSTTNPLLAYGTQFNYVGYVVIADEPTMVDVDYKVNRLTGNEALFYGVKPLQEEFESYTPTFSYLEFVDTTGTGIISLVKGVNYISVVSYSLEALDYKLSFKKNDKKVVNDTITIDSLLSIATPITSLPLHESVYLGGEPSHLVEGRNDYFRNSHKYYYATAYKMKVDSGLTMLLSEESTGDNYAFVYKQCADTIMRILDKDAAYNISFTSDSTTTYYFVFTDYSPEFKTSIQVSVDSVRKEGTVTIQELLKSVKTTITSLPSTTDHFDESAAKVLGDGSFRENNLVYYAHAYKMALDSGQHVAYTSDGRVDGAVDDYMYIYKQYADTIKMVADEDDDYPYYFTPDSTTTYYFVHTTYDPKAIGYATISIQPVSVLEAERDSLFAHALPLPSKRGTVEVPAGKYSNAFCNYVVIYKVALDSAQLFEYEGSPRSFGSNFFKLIGDTIVDYNKTNYNSILYADSATTYYLLVNTQGTKMQLEYTISDDYTAYSIGSAVATQTCYLHQDTISLVNTPMLQINHDINNSVFAAEPVSFNFKKGDIVALNMGTNNNSSKYTLMNKADSSVVKGYVGKISSNLTDTVTIAKDGTYIFTNGIKNYIGGTFCSAVNKVYANVDSLLAHTALSSTQNLQLKGTGVSNFTNDWVYYSGNICAAYAYRIKAEAQDILAFKVDNSAALSVNLKIYSCNSDGTYSAYTSYTSLYDYESNLMLYSKGEYALVFFANYTIKNNISNYIENDDEFFISLANTKHKTEVTSVAADVKYVTCDDNATAINWALGSVVVTAQAADGTELVIEHEGTDWVVDANATQAYYKVVLPKGYKFAEDVVDSVVVLVNPAVVSAVAGEHGSVSPSSERVVRRGTSLTFAIEAETGYVIDAIEVNGTPVSSDILNKASGEFTYKANKSATINISFKAATAIRATELSNAVVYSRERTIYVDGAELNADVRIFSITGTMIYAGRIGADIESYTMPSAGMYIIRIADKAEKVMVK